MNMQLQTVNAMDEWAPEVSFNVLSLFVLISFASVFRRAVATRMRSISLVSFFQLANVRRVHSSRRVEPASYVDTNDTQNTTKTRLPYPAYPLCRERPHATPSVARNNRYISLTRQCPT